MVQIQWYYSSWSVRGWPRRVDEQAGDAIGEPVSVAVRAPTRCRVSWLKIAGSINIHTVSMAPALAGLGEAPARSTAPSTIQVAVRSCWRFSIHDQELDVQVGGRGFVRR